MFPLRKVSLAPSFGLSLGMWTALLAFTAAAEPARVHPSLGEIRTVYLLSMSNGLDQYLANRLTKSGRFEVVTDPANADAVFTDRLGPAFEERWAELYPAPSQTPAEDAAKNTSPSNAPIDFAAPSPARISSFGRSRGNVFLVSKKTGAVVWSHYRLPSNSRPSSIDKLADKIVDRLSDDLPAKKK
jgi:hypothetical protein